MFIPHQYVDLNLRWKLKEYNENEFNSFYKTSYTYEEYMDYLRRENERLKERLSKIEKLLNI